MGSAVSILFPAFCPASSIVPDPGKALSTYQLGWTEPQMKEMLTWLNQGKETQSV